MGDATVEIGLEEYKQLLDDSTVLRLIIGYLANDDDYSTADGIRKFIGLPKPKKKADTAATETANDEKLPIRDLNMPIL